MDNRTRGFVGFLFAGLVCVTLVRGAAAQPEADGWFAPYLDRGSLTEVVQSLEADLAKDPKNDDLRFALGGMQFVRAVERMAQSWHRYGLLQGGVARGIPFMRLPVPPNPAPEPVTARDVRAVLKNFVEDMAVCRATLEGIGAGPVAVPVPFGMIRLDLNDDGAADDSEALWRVYAAISNSQMPEEQAAAFVIRFDEGDVPWLRAYTHLLSAFAETALAHDGGELFDHTAHLLFTDPVIPFPFLKAASPGQGPGGRPDIALWTDAVAFIHLLSLPVAEPAGMGRALAHLEAVPRLSRQSWELILAETDDDREWVPGPAQTGVLPGVKVTQEMVSNWMEFLDEAEAIFAGRKLLPFWREGETRGVNLRRVFTEPTRMDLVLWVQGTAAMPYLEEGEITSADFWRGLNGAFGGRFIGFAVWFN